MGEAIIDAGNAIGEFVEGGIDTIGGIFNGIIEYLGNTFIGEITAALFEVYKQYLNWIWTTILKGLLTLVVELYKVISSELFKVASGTFYPESQNGSLSSVYGMLNNTVKTISLSMLILMALYKGFTTYILWRDGNPEENPMEIIMRYIFVIALIFSFDELFGIAAGVINSLNIGIGGSVGTINSNPLDMDNIENVAQAIMSIILIIILIKQSMSAVFSLIGKNIEILILRIGFPLACVSAITPQANGFRNYISSMLKAMLSIVVMNVLIGLSIRILTDDMSFKNIIWSIAILQIVNHGGSIINSIVSTGGNGNAGESLGGNLQNTITTVAKTGFKVAKTFMSGGGG